MEKERVFELLENSEHLPKLSQNVSEILEMLKNPTGLDIDKLVQKVTQSNQLNDLMIKNLNSGYFQLNKKIATIKEAVVYLGMQTVQNLLIFFISRQLFSDMPRINKNRSFDMPRYWRHVIGTSVASCMLSSRIKQGDKYKLFSYGLIHDIGIALLDACLPELIDEVSKKLMRGIHQLVAERSVLGGITHAEVGAWLCRKWNIREDITNIVEYHHTPFFAKFNSDDVKLIHVADVFSTEYYEKLLGVNINHEINNQIMDSLGITNMDRQAVIDALPQEVDRLRNYFTV